MATTVLISEEMQPLVKRFEPAYSAGVDDPRAEMTIEGPERTIRAIYAGMTEGGMMLVDAAGLWAKIAAYGDAMGDAIAIAAQAGPDSIARAESRNNAARLANEIRAMLGLDPLP